MKYESVFELLADACGRAQVQSILVGGFAVNYHKYTRATNDIDFMMTEEDFEKIKPAFEEAGYAVIKREPSFARLERQEGSLPGAQEFFIPLDILFVDPKTFQGTLQASNETTLRKAKFRVISLNHLLAMKLHSLKNSAGMREDPDLTDLVRLIQNNRMDLKAASFRNLCLQYGTQELYDKIVEKVSLWKN